MNHRCCPSATGIGASPAPGLAREDPGDRVGEEVHATATSDGERASPCARRRCAPRPRHERAAGEDQETVDDERDDHDRDDAGEDLGDDAALGAVREEVAEIRHADEDADRGERDRAHGRDAEAREDHRTGERELDAPRSVALPPYPIAVADMPDGGIDGVESVGDGAHHERDRVDRERDDQVRSR